MKYEVTVPPASEPLSLSELKAHCRVTHDSEDALITLYGKAARKNVEDKSRRQLITATYRAYFDAFPCVIELPRNPVQSVASVQYVDGNGDTQTLAADAYDVDTKGLVARITPKANASFPTTGNVPNAVTVTFVAGYGDDASDVPESLRLAIGLLTAHYFENREATAQNAPTAIPFGIQDIINLEGIPYLP